MNTEKIIKGTEILSRSETHAGPGSLHPDSAYTRTWDCGCQQSSCALPGMKGRKVRLCAEHSALPPVAVLVQHGDLLPGVLISTAVLADIRAQFPGIPAGDGYAIIAGIEAGILPLLEGVQLPSATDTPPSGHSPFFWGEYIKAVSATKELVMVIMATRTKVRWRY